ncbi:MAG: DHH family phosphoesterase [Candidatus Woesearchaeota archaeon]
MSRYEQFKALVAEAAEKFKKIGLDENIRIVSHLDSDGICACSILVRSLKNENRRYSISIVHQLDVNVLQELSNEQHNCFVFADLGSGQLSNIERFLSGKSVFILDHHQPELSKTNVCHVNPHLCGVDGSSEISGAGVAYLFACALNKKNMDLAHLALIGAMGDLQEKNGFHDLNAEILQHAKRIGTIKVSQGIRVFGSQTRPVHKLLEYSTDPYIPGVSGSESAAIQFLCGIGINPKRGKDWKKLLHLTEEERQRLAAAIILRRSKETNPEDIFGFTYLLVAEPEESPLKDAKEFSTLLNACGRMNKASLGIGACIGNKESKQKAIQQLALYRKEILAALKWYQDNKSKRHVYKEDGFVIINAQDFVPFTFIGTLASILSKSKEFAEPTFILSMAYNNDCTIKASLRMSGRSKADLRSLVSEIVKYSGGEAGGHQNAAGALVPIDNEEKLISAAKEVLRKACMIEEVI